MSDAQDLLPSGGMVTCHTSLLRFQDMLITHVLRNGVYLKQIKMSDQRVDCSAGDIGQEGLGKQATWPACIHMLNVPEFVGVLLDQRSICWILTINGKKSHIVSLICQIKRSIADTTRIVFNFLNSGARTDSAI